MITQIHLHGSAADLAELSSKTVLYAGANLPSPAILAAYSPALSAFPAMGPSHLKEQPGTALISALEEEISDRVCAMFGASWAEPRLPSCTMANLAVFQCFGTPGALLLAPAAAHGGHLSQRRGGTPELAGLEVRDLPFDAANLRMDAARAAEDIRAQKPAMVMLGRSVILRPDDLAPVVQAAREIGALTIYDASHVLGLIAGGTFPNPLAAGIDLMTSSTYKTFPGRPHALVMGRDPKDGARLAEFIDRRFMANGDNGRLPQMLMSLREAAEPDMQVPRPRFRPIARACQKRWRQKEAASCGSRRPGCAGLDRHRSHSAASRAVGGCGGHR
ncbi:serine hydroxymethyltransferase [Paracoccus aminophilus]|uniref:Serine hydroxymethyltransferase n=1 Tax=Paracoccus aminophilus JCM 7686 TaxID=1367847 RepID=S5XU91_PARAH|nr:serine hydroxymethyltransferase [Paracoccus aminophilus]AGT08767.1 serine hydroxymethyltransferase [Paracoccus aminophilus JCM 7686]